MNAQEELTLRRELKAAIDANDAKSELSIRRMLQSDNSPGLGERVQQNIEAIPRNLGLTARHAVGGLADLAGIFTGPIEYGMNKLGIPTMPLGQASDAMMDRAGVPSPQTPNERIAGAASRVLSSGGGMVKGAQMAGKVPGAVGTFAESLAASPGMQSAGLLGGGLTGQYMQETGGGPWAQGLGAVAGSFGAAGAVGGGQALFHSMKNAATNVRNGIKGTAANVDDIAARLDQILANQSNGPGVKVGDLSLGAKKQMAAEIKRAYETGGQINDDVLRRLADYELVRAQPTRGTLTLDPVQVTQEKNLAKMGAQGGNDDLAALAQRQRNNDLVLMQNLDDLGANQALPESRLTGAVMKDALKKIDKPRSAEVTRAYQAVRTSQGARAELDLPAFSQRANALIDEKQLNASIPADARSWLNDVTIGKIPFRADTMMQMDKRLTGIISDNMRQGKGQAAEATRVIRDTLRETGLKPGQDNKAIDLYDKARAMAAARFKAIDDNPAMAAALDDANPDKFVETFIVGGGDKASMKHVAALAKEMKKDAPEAFYAARNQLLFYLKDKALGGGTDEVANFSPKAYNRALKAIGDTRLRNFFNKEELRRIHAVGRVASYEKFQPTGSAVNNSNSASAFARLLDYMWSSPVASPLKIPADNLLIKPAQGWLNERAARAAMNNTQGAALIPAPKQPLPYPAMLLPGLLSIE